MARLSSHRLPESVPEAASGQPTPSSPLTTQSKGRSRAAPESWPEGYSHMRALPLKVDLSLPPEQRWQAICGDEGFARALERQMTRVFTHFITRKLNMTPVGWIYFVIRLCSFKLLPPLGIAFRSLVRALVQAQGGAEAVRPSFRLRHLADLCLPMRACGREPSRR